MRATFEKFVPNSSSRLGPSPAKQRVTRQFKCEPREIEPFAADNDDYWPPDGEEAFFADDQTYVPIRLDGWRHGALWRRFREAILYRQRFFNDPAKAFLAEIFDGIQNQSDIDSKPAFYRLAPATDPVFYRARIGADEEAFRTIAKDPASLMGPPPPPRRRAGRMNAAGIAVFTAPPRRTRPSLNHRLRRFEARTNTAAAGPASRLGQGCANGSYPRIVLRKLPVRTRPSSCRSIPVFGAQGARLDF